MRLQIEMIAVDWQIRMRSNHLVVCGPDDHNIAEFRHVHSSPATPSLCFYCKVVKIGSSTHAVPLCLETAQTPWINVYSVAAFSTRRRLLGKLVFVMNELLWDTGVVSLDMGVSSVQLKCSRVRNGNDPSMRLVPLKETMKMVSAPLCGATTPSVYPPVVALEQWDLALMGHIHQKHAQMSSAYAACVANSLPNGSTCLEI